MARDSLAMVAGAETMAAVVVAVLPLAMVDMAGDGVVMMLIVAVILHRQHLAYPAMLCPLDAHIDPCYSSRM